MPSTDFSNFTKMVARKLHPRPHAKISSPQSPPRWEDLGWMVGWIVQEGYTGLQWWVTQEEKWEELTQDLGRSKQQKTQVFINWYVKRLKKIGREFGVPVRLESVRWRRIDFREIIDRPKIKEGDWWQVVIGEESKIGSWHLVVPERFYRLFEPELEESSLQLPWFFDDVWTRLLTAGKRQLLEELSREKGQVNHLASLIAAGSLKMEEIAEFLPRNPRQELENALEERRQLLASKSERSRRQTQQAWKQDAGRYLVKKMGELLEEGRLGGEQFKSFAADWEQYQLDLLRRKYGGSRWKRLWSSLDGEKLKQLIPRLNFQDLISASTRLGARQRGRIAAALPEHKGEQFEKSSEGTRKPEEILTARKKIYNQSKEIFKKMNIEPPEEWKKDNS
ncbi:MAG: hypothetical protein ACQEP7_04170 [bacterium]